MPITQITYSRNFAIGSFLYETIGATITLGENQDPKEAISAINKLACEWNEQNNPHLASQNTVTISQPPEPEVLPVTEVQKPPAGPGMDIEADIRSFTDYGKLQKVYGMLVKVQPSLKAVYEETCERLKADEIKSIMDRTNARIVVPKDLPKDFSKKSKTIGV